MGGGGGKKGGGLVQTIICHERNQSLKWKKRIGYQSPSILLLNIREEKGGWLIILMGGIL